MGGVKINKKKEAISVPYKPEKRKKPEKGLLESKKANSEQRK